MSLKSFIESIHTPKYHEWTITEHIMHSDNIILKPFQGIIMFKVRLAYALASRLILKNIADKKNQLLLTVLALKDYLTFEYLMLEKLKNNKKFNIFANSTEGKKLLDALENIELNKQRNQAIAYLDTYFDKETIQEILSELK
jgi:hypothetical protein